MISSSTWRCAALCCTMLLCLCCWETVHAGMLPEFWCRPQNCSMSLLRITFTSMCCLTLLLFFFYFLNIFHFCLVLVKKKKTSHRRVKVECSRLTMRSVNTNAPVAVINSNCSSSRSCAHTVVRVTESDQCYYWRPDGLQGFFLWMVATLFL